MCLMIFDYIKGVLFVVVFIAFLASFGNRTRHASDFSENLIFGFIIYTFFQFIGGFLAQQFRLPWIAYQIYMIMLLIGMVLFIFYKRTIRFNRKLALQHLKEYKLLYLLVFILVILAMLNLYYQWNGNNADDGYYLNKIRMAPYVGNYTDFNFATGFSAPGTIIRNVNTFEIEAAFFTQILGMDASIYAKVFLSSINYIILLNAIYYFYKNVIIRFNKYVIYSLITILFFGFYQEILLEHHLIYMIDAWQFNSAMWYGSTLVRTAGFFILLTPLLQGNSLNRNTICFFILSSVALLSKATQAMPVVYLCIVSYMVVYIYQRKVLSRGKLFAVIPVLCAAIILICIPLPFDAVNREAGIYAIILGNRNSWILSSSFLLILISYFLHEKKINKWNAYLLIIGILIGIPKMNHLFIILSQYDFVAYRIVTLYTITIVMTASLYLTLFLTKVINKEIPIKIIYVLLSVVLIIPSLLYINTQIGLKQAFSLILNNPRMIPEAAMKLGETLENISIKENEKLYVLSPMWFKNYNIPYTPAVMLRYNAFDIYSIGTCARYETIDMNSTFASFGQRNQLVFDRYNSGEDRSNEKLKAVLDEYPVNCIVVTYKEAANMLQELGYEYRAQIELDTTYTYFICVKTRNI